MNLATRCLIDQGTGRVVITSSHVVIPSTFISARVLNRNEAGTVISWDGKDEEDREGRPDTD